MTSLQLSSVSQESEFLTILTKAFFSLGLGASISASRRKFPNKKDSIKESLWDQGRNAFAVETKRTSA